MKPPIEFRPSRASKGRPKASTGNSKGGESAVTRPNEKPGSLKETSEPPAFDRNAYQREYMRRYRAKKAGK
jgi:hypothetical protein